MLKWVCHYVLHSTANFQAFDERGADGEKERRILELASSQISPPTGNLHVSTVAMKLDILAYQSAVGAHHKINNYHMTERTSRNSTIGNFFTLHIPDLQLLELPLK